MLGNLGLNPDALLQLVADRAWRTFVLPLLAEQRKELLGAIAGDVPASFAANLARQGLADLPAAAQRAMWLAAVDTAADELQAPRAEGRST